MAERTADPPPPSLVIPKPPGTREFSGRAIVAGIIVAALMGSAYPYIVLKLGFGPNVSVVAAFFGYMFLGIAGLVLRNRSNRWENNIVQTAGTSAAQTAFMCVILAAFDFLSQNTSLGYAFAPTPTESFVWLFAASVLGILLAVPLRRHYIEEEKLTYADGVAAAETVMVLDARGKTARQAAFALFAATVLSALGWLLTQKWSGEILYMLGIDIGDPEPTFTAASAWSAEVLRILGTEVTGAEHVIPEIVWGDMGGLTIAAAGAGFALSLLSIGSGMIVGNRINISMAIGGLLSVGLAARLLYDEGIIPDQSRRNLLLWVMWPGTGMLIAGGLTALFLKWRTLKRSFTSMSSGAIDSSEFPLKWVGAGVVAATIALLVAQYLIFDLAPWFTLIAIALSLPLMLVGLRVLGETNWGPISQLTNMMQAVFAALVPGNLTHNLAASGTTGTIAVQSEAIMQDYKAGHIIGSTPRFLTYAQLIAAPVGAAAVAFTYPLLKETYGIGGDGGLASPISIRIAGFANVLNRGFDALPAYSLHALVIGALVGILITLLETRWKNYVPSATGLGIGMMVPAAVVFSMVLGGILMSVWLLTHRRSAERLSMPLASGLIAGEAVLAILIPLFIAVGWLSP